MLVLRRKPGQSITIGDDIQIVVLQGRGNTVKIGIEAPSHISILRGELEREFVTAGDAQASASWCASAPR